MRYMTLNICRLMVETGRLYCYCLPLLAKAAVSCFCVICYYCFSSCSYDFLFISLHMDHTTALFYDI